MDNLIGKYIFFQINDQKGNKWNRKNCGGGCGQILGLMCASSTKLTHLTTSTAQCPFQETLVLNWIIDQRVSLLSLRELSVGLYVCLPLLFAHLYCTPPTLPHFVSTLLWRRRTCCSNRGNLFISYPLFMVVFLGLNSSLYFLKMQLL